MMMMMISSDSTQSSFRGHQSLSERYKPPLLCRSVTALRVLILGHEGNNKRLFHWRLTSRNIPALLALFSLFCVATKCVRVRQRKFPELNSSVWSSSNVQGFFICHIINYTGYNQKWNVENQRSFRESEKFQRISYFEQFVYCVTIKLHVVYYWTALNGFYMSLPRILPVYWKAIQNCVCVCVCACVCVCVCVHVYVVYEDTNLYNDMGMT